MLKVSSKIKANIEEEYEKEVNLNEFKGIYMNDNHDTKFYEGGAHFRYRDLCHILEKLVKTLAPDRKGKSMYEDWKEDESKKIDDYSSCAKTKANSRKYASDNSRETLFERNSSSKLRYLALKTGKSGMSINSGMSNMTNSNLNNIINNINGNNMDPIDNLKSNMMATATGVKNQNPSRNKANAIANNNTNSHYLNFNKNSYANDYLKGDKLTANFTINNTKHHNNGNSALKQPTAPKTSTFSQHNKSNSIASHNLDTANQKNPTTTITNNLYKKVQPKILNQTKTNSLPVQVPNKNQISRNLINEINNKLGFNNATQSMMHTNVSKGPTLNCTGAENAYMNNKFTLKKMNIKMNKSNNHSRNINKNEISTLSDLTVSMNKGNSRDSTKRNNNNNSHIIVKPKINLSFVNNINNLMSSIESLNNQNKHKKIENMFTKNEKSRNFKADSFTKDDSFNKKNKTMFIGVKNTPICFNKSRNVNRNFSMNNENLSRNTNDKNINTSLTNKSMNDSIINKEKKNMIRTTVTNTTNKITGKTIINPTNKFKGKSPLKNYTTFIKTQDFTAMTSNYQLLKQQINNLKLGLGNIKQNGQNYIKVTTKNGVNIPGKLSKVGNSLQNNSKK